MITQQFMRTFELLFQSDSSFKLAIENKNTREIVL